MRETAQELPRKAKSRRVKPCPPPSGRNLGVRTLGTPGCSHAVGRDGPRNSPVDGFHVKAKPLLD